MKVGGIPGEMHPVIGEFSLRGPASVMKLSREQKYRLILSYIKIMALLMKMQGAPDNYNKYKAVHTAAVMQKSVCA